MQSQKIPNLPGVYFFKNSRGTTLYIGKAANLRARLRSYLGNSKDLPSKTKSMLMEAASLSWEIVGSETEALIKESELIKKYRPKYNVLMRDDKQYFYVGFSKEAFPKIFITHQTPDSNNYIGPFTEGGALRSVLKTLRKAFPYCTCKKPHKNICLNARIGRCLGFCCTWEFNSQVGVELPSYQKNIAAIKKVLSGKNKSLSKDLKKEMRKLSDAQKYEEAGKIRDKITSLEKIFEHRGVIKQDLPSENSKALRALASLTETEEIGRIEAYDIANIQGKFAYGSMAVLENGILKKEDYRIFKIKTVLGSNDPAMINEVISRRLNHKEWRYPEVMIIDGGRGQLSAALAAKSMSGNFKIKIIALTKNKKHFGDHIFVESRRDQISLSKLPESLKNLILQLDSEAHRFAIKFYRKSHRKTIA